MQEKIKWARRSSIQRMYGIGETRMRKLVKDRHIRTAKFGMTAQALRLYNVGDVERVLADLSEGRKLKRPRRKSKGSKG